MLEPASMVPLVTVAPVGVRRNDPLVEEVANRFKPTPEPDKPLLIKIMLHISEETAGTAKNDTRTAEQAYMALDSLFRSYAGIKTGKPLYDQGAPEAGQKIEALYKFFDNPSAYDYPRFAQAMREVHNALLRANEAVAKKPSQSRVARKFQVGQAHAAN